MNPKVICHLKADIILTGVGFGYSDSNGPKAAEGLFAACRRYVLAVSLSLVLCLAWPGLTSAAVLGTFRYSYAVSWAGIGIGTLSLSLGPWSGHPGCYRYATKTFPNSIVRLLYGSPSETSLFCVVHGQIQSERFVSKLPGRPGQSYTLEFNWKRGVVTNNKGISRKIPADAVDSLAIQQAVRLWILRNREVSQGDIARFTMVDDKHLTKYKLKFDGKRMIKTPAGRFATLYIRRIDNHGKVAQFWLAPARKDMPVKSMVRNGGRPSVTLLLTR